MKLSKKLYMVALVMAASMLSAALPASAADTVEIGIDEDDVYLYDDGGWHTASTVAKVRYRNASANCAHPTGRVRIKLSYKLHGNTLTVRAVRVKNLTKNDSSVLHSAYFLSSSGVGGEIPGTEIAPGETWLVRDIHGQKIRWNEPFGDNEGDFVNIALHENGTPACALTSVIFLKRQHVCLPGDTHC